MIVIKNGKLLIKTVKKPDFDDLEAMKRYLIGLLNKIEKAGFQVGTIRTWNGKKYKKVAKDKWMRYYEGKDRGQEQAVRNVIKKIEGAKSVSELAEIIRLNRNRFKDADGSLDSIVKQFLENAKGKRPEKKGIFVLPKQNKVIINSGVNLVRDELTQKAKNNYVPDYLEKSLNGHQKDFFNLFIEKINEGQKGFVLADGTGVGKTREELAVASYYAKQNKNILYVTGDKRIISSSIQKDADAMDIQIAPVDSPLSEDKGKIQVTTYDKLGNFSKNKYDLIIFDESHNLKNYSSQKTKNGLELTKNAKMVLNATATPMDKAEHVGYICEALNLNFFQTMGDLGYELVEKNIGYGKTAKAWELKSGITNDDVMYRIGGLFDAITESGLMLKREVSMENINVNSNVVNLSDADFKKYEDAEKQFYDTLMRASSKEKGLTKARGLMNLRMLLEEMKIPTAVQKIKENIKEGNKVVVFASRVNDSDIKMFKSAGMSEEEIKEYSIRSEGTIKKLQSELEKSGINVTTLFSGESSGVKKKEQDKKNIDLFNKNDSGIDVILTTPQSGGTGLNLDDTEGNKPRTEIIMSAPFSANDVVQMLGRVNRLTTKSKSKAEFLFTDTMADKWNKDIILSKLNKLGASVRGDYENIDLTGVDSGLADGISSDEALKISAKKDKYKDFKVPLRFKGKLGKSVNSNEQIKEKSKVEFASTNAHYASLLPRNEAGEIDLTKPFPLVKFGYGKYKGQPINTDLGYLSWALGTAGIALMRHQLMDVKFE